MFITTKQNCPACCYDAVCKKNHYLEEFNQKYCMQYPDDFCHSKWRTYVPYLLVTPNNDKHFVNFKESLGVEKLDKYSEALLEYFNYRDLDIWEKALYLGKKDTFKGLCEFFCQKDEHRYRRAELPPYDENWSDCCIPF